MPRIAIGVGEDPWPRLAPRALAGLLDPGVILASWAFPAETVPRGQVLQPSKHWDGCLGLGSQLQGVTYGQHLAYGTAITVDTFHWFQLPGTSWGFPIEAHTAGLDRTLSLGAYSAMLDLSC